MLKGRYFQLQKVYYDKGLLSEEFYLRVVNYIRYLLVKHLRTYNYTEDQINDCYIEIIERVQSHYDPNKGCLGNFIRRVVQNYTNKFKYHSKPKTFKERKTKKVYQIEFIPLDFGIGNQVEFSETREEKDEEEVKQVLRDLKRLSIDEISIKNLYKDVLYQGYEHNAFYRMVLWEMMSK